MQYTVATVCVYVCVPAGSVLYFSNTDAVLISDMTIIPVVLGV